MKSKQQSMKRLLSLVMVIAMILAMSPVPAKAADEGTTLYVKPNANWLNDGARFAAYFFGNGEIWVDMTDANGDGYYECEAPEGYPNVIFCRMNPGTTENSWDNKWNQTADLTVPTDDNNCYTVAEGAWDNGAGVWSVYAPEEEEPSEPTDPETGLILYVKPNANWLNDGARFAAYFFGNGEIWVDMTDADGDGYYECEAPEGYTSVIFCRMNPGTTENSWDNKWNQTSDLAVPTDGTNCYTVEDGSWDNGVGVWSVYAPEEEEPSEPETEPTDPETGLILYVKPNANWLNDGARFAAYFFGNGEIWVDMTDADGDGYYECEAPEGYTSVIFCRMNPGATENSWDNKWNQTSDLAVPTDGTNCYTVEDGSWDNGAGVWSVYAPEEEDPTDPSEPEIPEKAYYVAGDAALCGVNWSANDAENQMTYVDGIYQLVYTDVAADTYSLKVTDGTWNNAWGDNGQNYTFLVSDVCDVTVTFDPATGTVNVTGAHVSKPTTLEITAMYAVGDGSGNWLNGIAWDPGAAANAMTEISDNVYQITFENVAAGSYQFKFAANGDWTHSWGGGGAEGEAVYNGQNISLTVSGGAMHVTLTIDLTGYDHSTKSGAKYTVALEAVEDGEDPSEPSEPVDPEIPEGYTVVTVHFLKGEGWGDTINAWVWDEGGALPGYEKYQGTWPGSPIEANSAHSGWYDLVIATENPQPFNFIFNDGANQTADLSTGDITGNTELWVIGNSVMTEAPGEWSGVYSYNVLIHFHNTAGWETVNVKFGQGDNWDPVAGYEEYKNNEFGGAMAADENNSGWYILSFTVVDNSTAINGLFNNGAWGDGNQTGNWTTGELNPGINEFWYDNGVFSADAPSSWFDPNRRVFVPGTFPGPSWDAGSNQMTFDEELGLYVYTFQSVPAANYEFKIAINGTWDENYGVGGAANGSNYSVSVPEEMDVTVYYNDRTHYAVTNVNYIFADILLSGTGIAEGTKLTDSGLTGIYSATVDLAAGTYSDVKLTMDGKDYAFAEFELDAAKAVTFYMDPVTGLFYHNASGEPIDQSAVYFDSQNAEYKSVFGAVATGEEVTFAIDTGKDITSAVLVIGSNSYPLEAVETESGKRWSGTVTLKHIGEYKYYFALSNGAAVGIYSDDDGYYGTGKLTDLTGMLPYDLIVYQAGFTTPEWMKNAVIYQIFPDRFFDGNESNNKAQTHARGAINYEYVTDWYLLPENPEQKNLLSESVYKAYGAYYGDGEWSNEIYGGDLDGITQRIGYLKSLGVNVIYLNPVFASISNHRYDALDYTEIDPILGTMGDFEELVAAAEANDMHIILDGVFNHVSDDSVYFDRYYRFLGQSEKIGAYPYWAYVYDYMAETGASKADAETAAKAYFTQEYGVTDYSYTEWFQVNQTTMSTVDTIGLRAGKKVYSYDGWWGYDSMPIIYSTNGSEYQTGNWAEEIIYNEDGSSVTQYWLTEGNDGWRLDVANEVSDETWIYFRNSVKGTKGDAVIIGEIWDDATHYLMGNMYDSVMNYLFRNAVTAYAMGTNAEQTTRTMEKIRERYPEEAFYAMMNLVGSHDTSRLLSYLDGIGDDRADKSADAAFPSYEKTSATAKNRQYLVSFLQFTYAGAPTIYYGDEIGMVGSDDPDDRRAFEWGKGNQELVEWYASLAAIREAYPALRTGSVEAFSSGSNVMGYVRRSGNEALIVLANNASGEKTVTLDLNQLNVSAESLVDLVSGETYTVADGKVTVDVDSLRGEILISADQVQQVTVNTAGLAPAYDAAYTVAVRSENPPAQEPEILLDAPVVTISNHAATGKIKLSWNAVENAAEYKVYRASSGNGEYALQATVTETNWIDDTTSPGVRYHYYVVAVAGDGTVSEASAKINRLCDLAKPVITLKNDAVTGKVKVTWSAVDGAVTYEIYRSDARYGTYELAGTATETSFLDASGVAGVRSYYKVKAIAENPYANSVFSGVQSRLCDLAKPVITLKNDAVTGKVKVSWSAVDGAAAYEVYRSDARYGTYELVDTVTETSFIDASGVAGVRSYYKVKAIVENPYANSVFSGVQSRLCDLVRPGFAVAVKNGKVEITVNAVEGAVKYEIYRSTTKNGTYTLVGRTENGTAVDDTVSAGTYFYKVRAIAENRNASSAYTTAKSVTVK